MKQRLAKPIIFILGSVIVLGAVAGGTRLTRHSRTLPGSPAHTASTRLRQGQTQQVAANSSTQQNTTSNAPANAAPSDGACALLTLAVAQKVLGPDAKSSAPGNTADYQAGNTSLSACAYANTIGSVQLVERTPTDSLGVSKNAVMFGSGKPSGAVNVQGYGQTAYWDSDKHCLNVLGNNNWYIITRSTGTQSDTEAVAKLLVSEF